MTRIEIGLGASGVGKVQPPGSGSYVDAPIYVGADDPSTKGAVAPYGWVDSAVATKVLAATVAAIGGKFWFGTQAAYDAVLIKDPATLYVVT